MANGIIPFGTLRVDLNTVHNQEEYILDFPANSFIAPRCDVADTYIQFGSNAGALIEMVALEKMYVLDTYVDRVYITNAASPNPYSDSKLIIHYADFNRVRLDVNTNYYNMLKAFLNVGLATGITAGALAPTWYDIITIDTSSTGETEYVHPFQQYVSLYPMINFVQVLAVSDATWDLYLKVLSMTPPTPLAQTYGDAISSSYLFDNTLIQMSAYAVKVNVTATGTSNIVLMVGGHYASLFEMATS